MNKTLVILEIIVILLLVFITFEVYECKKIYEHIKNKPAVETTGYYHCAGSKKKPRWCQIDIYRNGEHNGN